MWSRRCGSHRPIAPNSRSRADTCPSLRSFLQERPAITMRDRLAYTMVSITRRIFDIGTGYGPNNMTEAKWLNRIIFLETVAAIPGMVAGAVRHLHSLRLMKRDNGWIHTMLEEAENERMHLLTFIQLKQPGVLFRSAVLVAQGVLYNLFFASYLLSPKTVHRFVGHLEEQVRPLRPPPITHYPHPGRVAIASPGTLRRALTSSRRAFAP
jgi:hypothetical protein